MRANERRMLRQVRALMRIGDRAGAMRLIDSVVEPPRVASGSDQLSLSFMLSQTFHCRRLAVEAMTVRDCLERRGAVYPSGGRAGASKNLECRDCPAGIYHAKTLPSVHLRPSSQPPEKLPRAQWSAMMAQRSRTPLDPGRMDPMAEVASMSPEDDSDWRA